VIRNFVKEVRQEIDRGVKPERRTIFHDLLDPPVESVGKQREPLSDESVFADAVVLTGAGVETTGSTAERAIFEVISNPVIYKTLMTELREAFPTPDTMTLTGLELLPYLTAVIKEALRLVLLGIW
jgi:cytochrome P450